MPTTVIAHRAFISSPSDVAPERDIIPRVITGLNNIYLQANGHILWPVMWETMLGGLGVDVQDVINRQTPVYDIFVGIVWSRFGTPTKRAGSGTEEEFDYALQTHLSQTSEIDFMIFVKVADLPHTVDEDQLKNVKHFIEKLKASGIFYHTFRDLQGFEGLLRQHLLQYIATRTSPAVPTARNVDVAAVSARIEEKPHLALIADIVRFSDRLKQSVDLILSKNASQLDQGRRLLREATVSLVTDAGANIKKTMNWTYAYGRTCYTQTQPPCDPQERASVVSELERIADQIADWRRLMGAAPSGDPSVNSDFALAREFLDYCACAVQTSAYGLSPRSAQ